ncbi:MAG: SO_0444 family Cu/Zn efflux transporter [Candidatus Omnitrophota bacterium]|nr:SO_0444 family Cu/Zn efflux transporter [Candidatus Omnitrophota bacterium]
MSIDKVPFGLINEIWRTFNDAALYILFGIFIAGLIQIFVDKEKIAKYLGKPGIKSVVLAAILGVPLPLCSCGVIPMAVSLKKSGASKGATLSFLISTPESGIDSIAISFALLDPLMTIFRPIAAFITAIVAGISENVFGRKDTEATKEQTDTCIFCEDENDDHNHSLAHKFKYGMRYAFTALLGDIAKWLTLGIVIGGVISYFVPQEFIENYLGSGWQAMLIMLVIGIPLYICASASTPIAAALIAKGMSPGVALVFLLAGPATNMASILAVGKFLDKRAVVIYLVSISVCAVGLGLLLNQIYVVTGLDIHVTLGKAGEIFPPFIKTASSIALIALMINSVRRPKKCSTR